MNLHRVFLPAVLLATASCALAQTGTGTVTGHVTCGDTQRPARFATVTLFAVPTDATAMPDFDKDDVKNLGSLMSTIMGGATMVSAQTSLDGSFTTAVAPGDYYAFATLSGYTTPMSAVQSAIESGADMKKPLPGVPIVHVVAEHGSNIDVVMQRGAAISGTVRWDDGSPVAGAVVTVESAKSKGKKEAMKDMPVQFAMLATTDAMSLMSVSNDLGQFRVSGLAPGEYRVHAALKTGSGMTLRNGKIDLGSMKGMASIEVYAPSSFHVPDAAKFTVKAGDEHGDTDITVNLNSTHTVSGRVMSAEDHHGINSGEVKLTDASDKEFSRTTSVDATGNYTVQFVPAGTYNLTVADAADTEPSKKKAAGMFASEHTIRSYDEGKASVIVADSNVTGQDVELKVSKKTKEDIDMNSLFGGATPSK